MIADELFVVERHGRWWAIPAAVVERLDDDHGEIRIRTTTAMLQVDRVVTLARAVSVTASSRILGRFWDQPHEGLAVIRGRPVVVLDPRTLPVELICEGEPHEPQQ